MSNNTITNIPDMYGAGFMSTFLTHRLNQLSDQSQERHHQVLAAERMVTLISEIQAAKPDETVTLTAHSKGTAISLLAHLRFDTSIAQSACVSRMDTVMRCGREIRPARSGMDGRVWWHKATKRLYRDASSSIRRVIESG